MTRFSSLLLLLTAGCVPNNAELTSGAYLGFFPTDGSPVVREGRIRLPEEGSTSNINCSPNPAELEGQNDANCAALELSAGDPSRPHEPWVDDDSFIGVHSTIEPWRGEGILTNEGDLQVTFHHRLTANEDFRFLFVIDPDFQPQRCVQGQGGESQWENVDGDWLEQWSTGLDGQTRYLLNAGSSQIDPTPQSWDPANFVSNEWFLPEEWFAGTSVGRYGPSLVFGRRPNYEYPWIYAAWNQGFENLENGPANGRIQEVENVVFYDIPCEDVEEVGAGIATDLQAITAGLPGAADMRLAPAVECNQWREQDDVPAGLDGWRAIHYNWVDIDNGSDMQVGGSVSGNFHLVLEGNLSQTVFIVDGTFTVDKIKREKWGNPDLNAELLEENDVQICGGAPSNARLRHEKAVRSIQIDDFDGASF